MQGGKITLKTEVGPVSEGRAQTQGSTGKEAAPEKSTD